MYWSYGRIASVWASKKSLYQTPIRPRVAGRFFSSGAVRKCSSMACPPASISSKLSMPMKTAIGSPIALHREYRPPTQSQNANMFFVSMPNFVTSFSLVERATKCLATCFTSPAVFRNHSLAVVALVIVSCVVNVLLATIQSVVSGWSFLIVSATWVPSTFDTK